MSSAQNKPHQSPKSASPPKPQADDKAPPASQPPLSTQNMDQPLDSPLLETPPAPSIPSEVMSSTETTDSTPNKPSNQSPPPPSSAASAAEVAKSSINNTTEVRATGDSVAEATVVDSTVDSTASSAASDSVDAPAANLAAKTEATASGSTPSLEAPTAESIGSMSAALRQQPIPPASEPMQYRAIGLVRGKYIPSEEQFTRGTVETDDGVSIGAVLLGRVMSLVKKHLDLEQSHLWVVYPRTREKGDTDLHVQIVGVWEPEKLNRLDSDADFDSEMDEAETESAMESEEDLPSAEAVAEVETMTATASSDDLDDRYFSVRGEIVYQSAEDQSLLVKIRRMPRPGSTESKAFKVVLQGVLEGKAVGYFWDLNVQRQGNVLVVQDGTMIGLVPPQKRDKSSRDRGGRPPFRRGGPGGGRPGGARRPSPWGGGSREGQPRPSRPGDRDRSSAPPNPNRPASGSKPVLKRRKENPEAEG